MASKIVELYFCLELTENEHYIVESDIINKCKDIGGIKLIYYRELKEGNVQLYREIKLKGNRTSLEKLKNWMRKNKIDLNIKRNPYSESKNKEFPFITNNTIVNRIK